MRLAVLVTMAPSPRSRPTMRAIPKLLAGHRVLLAYALARRSAGQSAPGFIFYATCARCQATIARSLERVPFGRPHQLDGAEPVLRCERQDECPVCGAFEIDVHAEEQQEPS